MNTLKKGDIITIIGISDWMATTTRNTLKATGLTTSDGKPVFTDNKKGARKKFTIRKLGRSDLCFKGEVPFKLDSEVVTPGRPGDTIFSTQTFRGNACINLVGDPTLIKEYITSRNINPDFHAFDAVILIDGDKETPLFPEVPTTHAVVERIRAAITN